MSTVERKEYQQTQILRTVSPVRTTRSTQNLNEFDSNLGKIHLIPSTDIHYFLYNIFCNFIKLPKL